jgi:hypothetical protein
MGVIEVYADGHDDLEDEHLRYVRDMANRVGFTVIDRYDEGLARIQIEAPMSDPVFLVRLSSPEQVVKPYVERYSVTDTITE